MDYFFNFEKLGYLRGDHGKGCILCRIRDRSSDVVDLTVLRDAVVFACVNLYPYNPGHLMIVPNRHIEDLRNYTPEEVAGVERLTRRCLDVLDHDYRASGYNIGYNMGLAAGASISHLHLHIIPRYPRELGIADLIAGKRVLVESPIETARRIKESMIRSQ